MTFVHIDDLIEDKARTDGNYAIAYALLKLAESNRKAIQDLGESIEDAAEGAAKYLARSIESIGD